MISVNYYIYKKRFLTFVGFSNVSLFWTNLTKFWETFFILWLFIKYSEISRSPYVYMLTIPMNIWRLITSQVVLLIYRVPVLLKLCLGKSNKHGNRDEVLFLSHFCPHRFPEAHLPLSQSPGARLVEAHSLQSERRPSSLLSTQECSRWPRE